MPDLDYVKVIGRLGIVVRDSEADVNAEPDTVWCDEGEVHFTPLVAAVKVAEADPVPITLGRSTIIGTIDAEGYLSLRGIRSVMLEDLTSEKVNPRIEAGKATHKVEFIGLMADGEPVTLPSPVNVRFAADTADEFGNCDLTLLMPVPVSGGTAQIVGPRGPSAYQVWIAAGNTGTFADFMAEYVEVEIPARLGQIALNNISYDLDTATDAGWYFANAGALARPADETALLSVTNLDNTWIQQTWRGVATGDVWTRLKKDTGWGVWSRNYSTAEDLDARYLNIGEGITDEMLPARLRTDANGNLPGGDWNLAIDNGWYRAFNATNAPFADVWYVGEVVKHDNDWVTQELWCFTDADPQTRFRRQKRGGVWGPWRQVADERAVLDSLYLNIGEGIQDSMLPARLRSEINSGSAVYSDLNDALDSGWVGASLIANGYLNTPEDGLWNVEVVAHNDAYVQQTAYGIAEWMPSYKHVWRRFKNGSGGGTWTAWERVYDGQAELDARYINHTDVLADSNLPARLRGDIQFVTDWNTATDTGFYGDHFNAANAPLAGNYWLGYVVRSASWIYQTAWNLGGSNSGDTAEFRRRRNGSSGQWEAWYRVYGSEAELDARYLNHTDVLADANLPARIQAAAGTTTDWNAAIEPGWYISAPGAANEAPIQNAGYYCYGQVEAKLNNSNIVQTVYTHTNNTMVGKYRRVRNASTWTAWAQIRETEAELDARYRPYARQSVSNPPAGNWQVVSGGETRGILELRYIGTNRDHRMMIAYDVSQYGHGVINVLSDYKFGGVACISNLRFTTDGTNQPRHLLFDLGNKTSGDELSAEVQFAKYGTLNLSQTGFPATAVETYTKSLPDMGEFHKSAKQVTNANNAVDNGIYWIAGMQTGGAVNAPNVGDAWGYIKVTTHGGLGAYIHQEWIPWEDPVTSMGRYERRWRSHTGWTSWVRMRVREDELDSRYMISLPENQRQITDPDTVVKTGYYHWNGNDGTKNAQSVFGYLRGGQSMSLHVISHDDGNWIQQWAHNYDDGHVWFRQRRNGVWQRWTRLQATDSVWQKYEIAASQSGRNLIYNADYSDVADRTLDGALRPMDSLESHVRGWWRTSSDSDMSTGGGTTWRIGGPPDGRRALGLSPANNTSGGAAVSPPFKVKPGKRYRWRVKIWSDQAIASGIYLLIRTGTSEHFTAIQDGTMRSIVDLILNQGHPGQQYVQYEGYWDAPNPGGFNHGSWGHLRPAVWTGTAGSGSNCVYWTDWEFEEVITAADQGDSGWLTPTLENGWTGFGQSWETAKYRKVGNRVSLRGLIGAGTVNSSNNGNTIFTLPAGFRPTSPGSITGMMFPVISNSTLGEVRVHGDGTVRAFSGSNVWMSLDGISFLVD